MSWEGGPSANVTYPLLLLIPIGRMLWSKQEAPESKEGGMKSATTDMRDMRSMRENVTRAVNSLELCWGCERVCACEQWVVKQEVALWLCNECLSSVSKRLESNSSGAIALRPATAAR